MAQHFYVTETIIAAYLMKLILKFRNVEFHIWAMYAAPSEGHDVMRKAIEDITTFKSNDIEDRIVAILVGDFNDYPDDQLDKSPINSSHKNNDRYDALKNHGFTDTCRFLYPYTNHFSWHSTRGGHNISSRIDQIWISSPAAANICEYFTHSSHQITDLYQPSSTYPPLLVTIVHTLDLTLIPMTT